MSTEPSTLTSLLICFEMSVSVWDGYILIELLGIWPGFRAQNPFRSDGQCHNPPRVGKRLFIGVEKADHFWLG